MRIEVGPECANTAGDSTTRCHSGAATPAETATAAMMCASARISAKAGERNAFE